MRPLLIFATLAMALQSGTTSGPQPEAFRFSRQVLVDTGKGGEASLRSCVPLDASVFAHAAPALIDLRLFGSTPGSRPAAEVPYALTISEAAAASDSAAILNLGMQGRSHIVFDLQMPSRPYSEVDLDLQGEDFLAAARVSGLKSLNDPAGTSLGTFTLFDLTGQRLGRSTSVPLSESRFPFLHIDLAFSPLPGPAHQTGTPGIVRGATVPPSREAQTVYTVVAESTSFAQRGTDSVASFDLPAHVPVERVSFVMRLDDKTNFSRTVRICARAATHQAIGEQPANEEIMGRISRIRLKEAGQEIHEAELSLPAIVGSNVQEPARVEIAIENGDDRPLLPAAVRLEMRQRKLCFDEPPSPVSLFYGADGLKAPQYDYSQLFQAESAARTAGLGAEEHNPLYTPHVEAKAFTERHPQVLWIALMAAVTVLALIAFRSGRSLGREVFKPR